MNELPYTALTSSGNRIRFEFPLHPLTESPEQVSGLLTRVLDAIDAGIRRDGGASDGDVMQALCMALAVRTRMVDAAGGPIHRLAGELATAALDAESRHSDRPAH